MPYTGATADVALGAHGITGAPFTGDSGSGGTSGLVPAPAAGDAAAGKYLAAGGGYGVPPGTGGGGTPGATVFSSTTTAGPNDSASETSLIGTVTGSKTIAANTFTNGAVLQAHAQGFFSLPVVSDSLTLKMKCGTTVIGSAVLTPGAGVLTNGSWRFWLDIAARGTGAGGAFITNGLVELTGAALTDTTAQVLNTTTVAFDFTTACVFDVTAQWGAAQVGETIQGTNIAAWFPGGSSGGGGISTNTGTYAALPPAGNAGNLYFPTDDFFLYRDNGTTWDGWYLPQRVLNPPSTTGFAWVNQVSSSATAQGSALYISTPGGASGTSVSWYVHTAPATPWTFTALIAGNVLGAINEQHVGLVFYESGNSHGEACVFSADAASNTGVFLLGLIYDSPTSFNNVVNGGNPVFLPNHFWMKIADDGTNRTCKVSLDGFNYFTIYSKGDTSFLTPDSYGFHIDNAQAAGNWPSGYGYTVLSALQN